MLGPARHAKPAGLEPDSALGVGAMHNLVHLAKDGYFHTRQKCDARQSLLQTACDPIGLAGGEVQGLAHWRVAGNDQLQCFAAMVETQGHASRPRVSLHAQRQLSTL